MPILILPFSEQQKIVNFLDYKTGECDRFIANRQKQIELLNEQKAAIINKAVTKGINPNAKMKPSGIEWIGDIPKHWGCTNLKRLTRLAYGDSLSDENRNGGDVPVYGSNGIVGFHDKAITKSPCIIIGRKGSYGKINYSEVDCFPIDTSYFIDSTQTKCDLKWLTYFLNILRLDENTLDDTVPGLSREWVYKMPIVILPFFEQQEITNFIKKETSKIETLISKYQKQIDLMQEYRTALISQAVTGKIDVRDWKPPTK